MAERKDARRQLQENKRTNPGRRAKNPTQERLRGAARQRVKDEATQGRAVLDMPSEAVFETMEQPEISKARRAIQHRPPPTPGRRAASGTPVDKIADRTAKLGPGQKTAIEAQELGIRPAGREFKHRGDIPQNTPAVKPRPPMANESERTDQNRHGGRKRN